jgi:hypothetical protein
MPIRTNRGRAAVYRRLWGWPMRSPRHLAVIGVVVAVLVIAVGVIVPQVSGTAGRGGAAAATTSNGRTTPATLFAPAPTSAPGVTGTTSRLPTRITSPTEAPTSAPPAPAALDVAESWGRAFVTHPEGVTNEKWLADLRPFTTEECLTEMSTVEPSNIKATQVTGPPVSEESFTSSVRATVPTDGGGLRLTVIETPDGWRVAFYEQVDA